MQDTEEEMQSSTLQVELKEAFLGDRGHPQRYVFKEVGCGDANFIHVSKQMQYVVLELE